MKKREYSSCFRGNFSPGARSYTETDPVAISLQGVQKFRAERFDVIIVDTSGRHRQESELFDEMVQIQEAVEPDMTVLVLDGAIGTGSIPSPVLSGVPESVYR